MANETNLIGVIEIYDRGHYDKLFSYITNALKDNFLNISIHESFLNNRGSLLIPFAKCFRSETDDDAFISGKMSEIINEFSFIDLFAVEIYIDSVYLKNRCYRALASNGKYEKIEKFNLEFSRLE